MVARWPGKIAAGTVSGHICGFQDMLATFAELGGAAVKKRTDGISIVPTLLGRGGQERHEYLYWELKGGRAVRMGEWKAVKGKGGIELFNLRKDPSEKNDVAAKHPDVVEKVRGIMEGAHEDSGFFAWQYEGPTPEKKNSEKSNKRRQSRTR